MAGFKRRWGLKTFRSHGESGDCDDGAVQSALPSIRENLVKYSEKDIYNGDEFELNYKTAPTSTIAVEMLPGRKKEKQRFTVLAYANSDGSEKFDLTILGIANKPRAFNKRTGFELGFDYYANRQSWMTQSLFFNWLQRFDSHVARTKNRKVVLLLDNFTPHGSPQNLPDLQNVDIIFYRPTLRPRYNLWKLASSHLLRHVIVLSKWPELST